MNRIWVDRLFPFAIMLMFPATSILTNKNMKKINHLILVWSLFLTTANAAPTLEWSFVGNVDLSSVPNTSTVDSKGFEFYPDRTGGGVLKIALFFSQSPMIEKLFWFREDGSIKYEKTFVSLTQWSDDYLEDPVVSQENVIFTHGSNLHILTELTDGSIEENIIAIDQNEDVQLGDGRLSAIGHYWISSFDSVTGALSVKMFRLSPPPPSIQLAPAASGIIDGQTLIRWIGVVGENYQVQRSTDFNTWVNVGSTITGNGDSLNYAEPIGSGNSFFRVVIP
jgi:hypothetical protein